MALPRGNTKLSGFYYPWPLRNIPFARQIDQSRENTFKLAPLTRAAYVDPQPVTANNPGGHDLAGWAIGMRDFRNKFRIWYDQVNMRFAIQHNIGTENVETWDEMLWIRESDGRVTVVQDGGLEAQGGFYNQVPRNLATSGRFAPASTEWVFTHNLNTKPILWDTFNLDDKSVIPQTVDVSNPNIAYFYWAAPQAGFAVVTGEQSRFSGIHVDDGNGNVFPTATRLGFNGAEFYASTDGHGMPVINLQPLDLSQSDPNTIPVNLKVTDTGLSKVFDFSTISSPELIFNQADFYFDTNPTGNPVINIRGGAGGGGGGQFGTGIQAQDFTTSSEWQFNHGLGVNNIVWAVYDDQGLAVIPQKVSVHNNNLAFFYFTPAMAGRAVVAGGPLVNTISVAETDGNPPTFTTGKLTFNSNDFYLDSDSAGKPIVNFRGTSGGGGGGSGITAIVQDTNPQLGGNLDVNGFTIHGTNGVGVDGGSASIVGGSSDTGRPGNVFLTSGHSTSNGDGFINIEANTGSVNIDAQGVNITGGPVDVGGHIISSVTDPVNPQDAATKNYVDTHSSGGGGGGGFYGIIWSDGTVTKQTDRLSFNGTEFYLDGSRPTVNIKESGINHSLLANLSADGHTQYIRVDGTRAFTGPQSMGSNRLTSVSDPSSAQDAATKNYVDTNMAPGFYGIFIRESDGNPPANRNDTIIFDSAAFYINSNSVGKPMISFRGSIISGSGGITAVVQDPAPQLGGALNAGGFQITNMADPSTAQGAATKNYVDTTMSPGFYGVFIKESRSGATVYKNDTLIFDSGAFYINPTSIGKPMVSLRSNPGIPSVSADPAPTLGANLNASAFRIVSLGNPVGTQDAATKNYVDTNIGPGFYGIIVKESDGTPGPARTDTLIFDSLAFYLNSDSTGHTMVSARANSFPGLVINDGVHNLTTKNRLNVNDKHFYLSQTASGDPMLNLRYEEDIYPIFIELASVQNVVIDPFAQYPYVLNRANLDCRSGSATGGFYIIPANNPNGLGIRVGRGQPVGGFDQIPITTTPNRLAPTSNANVNPGDCVMFTLYGNNAAKHIRITLVARKPS